MPAAVWIARSRLGSGAGDGDSGVPLPKPLDPSDQIDRRVMGVGERRQQIVRHSRDVRVALDGHLGKLAHAVDDESEVVANADRR